MGGLIQTYRTGGALSSIGSGSGNTGVPLGPVDDWAGLAAIPPKENALVNVESLGTGNSNGIAIYDGAQWQLYSGIFDSVVDMNAFAEPIATGALASVEETGDDNENAVRYQYDGAAWVRTAALSSGYAWVLSSITDTDPSGCGVTRAGDYGTLNGRTYRLTAPLALPGGGTRAMWADPRVYAGTVAMAAYLDGTEDVTGDTALNARGWPTVARTNGAITSQTTRVRLATSAASGAVSISTLTSGVTPTTRVYAQMLWRAAVGNASGNNSTTTLPFEFADGAAYFTPVYHSLAVSKGTYFWTGVGTDTAGVAQPSQSAVPGLSESDDLFEVLYDGMAGIAQMWRNGVLVASAVGILGAVADRLQIRSLSGSTASQTASQDVSAVKVVTW